MGGTIKAIEDGWFQKEIADSAYDHALRKASGEHPVIGVNKYVEDGEDKAVETHPYDPQTETRQIAGLHRTREERDEPLVQKLLDALETAAGDPAVNIMPATIAAVDARASMGEIVERLKALWGTYRESPVF